MAGLRFFLKAIYYTILFFAFLPIALFVIRVALLLLIIAISLLPLAIVAGSMLTLTTGNLFERKIERGFERKPWS